MGGPAHDSTWRISVTPDWICSTILLAAIRAGPLTRLTLIPGCRRPGGSERGHHRKRHSLSRCRASRGWHDSRKRCAARRGTAAGLVLPIRGPRAGGMVTNKDGRGRGAGERKPLARPTSGPCAERAGWSDTVGDGVSGHGRVAGLSGGRLHCESHHLGGGGGGGRKGLLHPPHKIESRWMKECRRPTQTNQMIC